MRSLSTASLLASSLAKPIGLALLIHLLAGICTAQQSQLQKTSIEKSRNEEVRLGSQTATGGFQNEDEIRDKFNNWQQDSDARSWLEGMNYHISDIQHVKAVKPHGEKADVEIRIKTKSTEYVEGISIKLVSNPQGFNQIDKRWLKTYVQMWSMPGDVHTALQLFVGEIAPTEPGRDSRRMFLNELNKPQQEAVVDFFRENREKIISDLFQGDGEHSAGWFMVTLKSSDNAPASSKKNELNPRWMLCSTKEAVALFGSGKVQITPSGSLKIGRITMQRKGGDNGRESAKMLQFKINPTELFELRK